MSDQKKSKIPYIFFAFFAVVFSVDFFFIYLSRATWRGIVTENSYEKGLNYNQTLAEERRQNEFGWKVNVSFANLSDKSGNLLINLHDKNLSQIADAEISVEVRRPVQDGYDFVQTVDFVGGIYEAKMKFPLKGQWDFLIKIKKGDDIFRETKRFVVQ